MTSQDAHEPLSANLFAVTFDCFLIIAIAAAYVPQLRRLRGSTTGDNPSIGGLSPYYIFAHAIFCSSQLSYAALIMCSYDHGKFTRFGAFGWWLGIVQVFVQWLCALSIVAVYVIGRSKGLRGKICTPVLVLIHAFFSAFVAFVVAGSGGMDSSLMGALIGGVVALMHYVVSPLALIMQIVSQRRELQKRDDLGALSLRSFALQAAVMLVLALRLIVKLGWWPSLDQSRDQILAEDWANSGILEKGLRYALAMWQMDHVSWNYMCWVGGAVFVWHKTVYRKDIKGRDVDFEGSLGSVRL